MAGLRFSIRNLDGELVDDGHITQHDQGSVTIRPFVGGGRDSTVDVSLDDPACTAPRALSRTLHVTYGDELAFVGPIGRPLTKLEAGIVTVPARDQRRRLERRNLRFGMDSVDDGYSFDGDGVWQLISDADATDDQLDRGVRGHGIVRGVDTSEAHPTPLKKAERGGAFAGAIDEISSAAGGPDIDLRPVDADHPPTSEPYDPGVLAEVNVYDSQGTDRSQPGPDRLLLAYGCGPANLADAELGPDADAVITFSVFVNPGGEIDAADADHRRLAHDEDAWLKTGRDIGIYESWESGVDGDTAEQLQAKADQRIEVYSDPPEQLTLTVKPDGGENVPIWGRDFDLLDKVAVAVRKGHYSWAGTVRITEITLRQANQDGQVQAELKVVPVAAGVAVDSEDGS